MSFAEAIRKGLAANEQAVANRREQNAILDEAARELSNVIGVPIALRFTTTTRQMAVSMFTTLRMLENPTITVDVLEARSEKAGRFRHLADVTQSELGYPVSFKWGNRSERASNAEEFRAALEALLSSRSGGEGVAYVAGLSSKPAQ